ncbi:hypothetical protein AAVH_28302 [Aphelenchoides avenae]|nr:hypothetical protein AAVH_28302 [Aphelenchus avenae]
MPREETESSVSWPFSSSLVASAIIVIVMHPKLLDEMHQEQFTGQLVGERMRDKFGIKSLSKGNEGMTRKGASTEGANQLKQVNLRLERTEASRERHDWALTPPSQPTNVIHRAERTAVSSSYDLSTQADFAKGP